MFFVLNLDAFCEPSGYFVFNNPFRDLRYPFTILRSSSIAQIFDDAISIHCHLDLLSDFVSSFRKSISYFGVFFRLIPQPRQVVAMHYQLTKIVPILIRFPNRMDDSMMFYFCFPDPFLFDVEISHTAV
ncbi:MAG: hypothetical protein CMJ95_08915 [Planctomycetes bacterium]|nr:hypothetical protein [Planctomycetota bacterium]